MSSSSFSPSSMLNFIWGQFTGFLSFFLSQVEGLIGTIFSGFGLSILLMFQSFASSVGQYGIMAPVMFVIGIGSAIMVAYVFFTFIGAEKDITEVEGDV